MEVVERHSVNIRDVKDVASLLAYFHYSQDWDLGIDSFEEVEYLLYDFSAADLCLKDEEFAKIKSLRQLPPWRNEQLWGIFCVEFETEKLSITALRKILSRLVPTRRNATNHAVWDERDLLFLCFWGTGNNRTVCVAHFESKDGGLAAVRTIHCAPALEDPVVLKHFEDRLCLLQWPEDPSDYEAWHAKWASAFTTGYHEVIKTSAVLADRMAEVAVEIRDTIIEAMEVETANGFAHLLFEKVRQTLVHDLTVKDFASMYAQTIVYGLFSARCLDKTPEDFSVEEAIDLIPSTNPFLKGLMKDCLGVRRGGLAFDELGIGDVVDMFAHVDAAVIAADFGRRTSGGREDPVIYFYEEFLKAYDKAQKVKCGEFYTPMPVVGFMVRAVDYILRTQFNMPDGLATEAMKKVKVSRVGKNGKAKTVTEDAPAIQILDPALGTGTFLREIILNIYETFKKNYAKSGGPRSVAASVGSAPRADRDPAFIEAWSRYVDRNVLPRLNGFELMMAPYAIAHMKLAMVLQDTGYNFKSDKRLQVYLTNSLEEPGDSNRQMELFEEDPLAAESVAANAVKKNNGINIVIGNPPYSVSSNNKGEWITNLLKNYKEGLNEKKLNLDDDYIKFIRLAQSIVERSGGGILAYISNNSFLDGITHRQMRKSLMESFDEIYILNLHGNARKKETAPDGSKDENVFDIMQGVSINIFVKKRGATTSSQSSSQCRVFYVDLYGMREVKYKNLETATLFSIDWQTVELRAPYYFFVPKDFSTEGKYNKGFSIVEMFPLYNSGIQTKRDDYVCQFDENAIREVITDLKSDLPLETIRQRFHVGDDGVAWSIEKSREDVLRNAGTYCQITYRLFDFRWTYYTGQSSGFMARPREKLFRHFVGHENIGLLARRNTPDKPFTYVSVCGAPISEGVLGVDPNGREYAFPLYLYQDYHGEMQKVPNLNSEIVKKIETALGEKPTPEDIFNYIYAVLHSPSYREKYKEFLKIDFPRIPYPTDAATFHALATLGAQLVAIHTMKDFDEADDVAFDDAGGREVVKVAWKDGAVYINKESRFTGVDETTWNQYIGGYQPLQKWLKDRKGRKLSAADVSHYKRIVRALRRTSALMAEIDKLPVTTSSTACATS